MSVKKHILSQEGYEKVIAEIVDLKERQIPEILEVLKDARSHGDLSENSDYHAAKDTLAFLQRRLAELEEIAENVEIVQDEKHEGHISLIKYGSIVTLEVEGDKQFTVEIVGGGEVQITGNLSISLDSPLGMALDGKKQGDVVEMKLPAGNKKVTILSVE